MIWGISLFPQIVIIFSIKPILSRIYLLENLFRAVSLRKGAGWPLLVTYLEKAPQK